MTDEINTTLETRIDAVTTVSSAPTGVRCSGPPELLIEYESDTDVAELMEPVETVLCEEWNQTATVLFEPDPTENEVGALVWSHPVSAPLEEAIRESAAESVWINWDASTSELEEKTFSPGAIDYTDLPPLSISIDASEDAYDPLIRTVEQAVDDLYTDWDVTVTAADSSGLDFEVTPD